jgi:hypothetical protein
MKYSSIAVLTLGTIFVPAMSLAAGVSLHNGGLGQAAQNTQSFGVAVCNDGTQALNQTVPISVTANDKTVTVPSAASIKPGNCAYSYLTYAPFGMWAGTTYSVSVTIDPDHSVITGSNNQASYSVTVPKASVAAAPAQTPANGIANVSFQSGNFFTMLVSWLSGIFK